MKCALLAVFGALFALCAIVIIAVSWNYLHCPKDAIAELKRDQKANLKAVTISGFYDGTPFSTSLSEPGALAFLSTAFRDASDDVGSGWSLSIKLLLSDGVQSDLELQLPKMGTQFYIWVEKPFPSDGKMYCVTLKDPIPKEVSDALLKIRNGQVTNRNYGH